MFEINYIVTKSEKSGRSVYEGEIRKRLKGINLNIIEYFPSKINVKSFSFIDRAVKRFFFLPCRIKRKIKKDDITHLTSEDFAYLLNFIKFKKSIITCHDLSPLTFRSSSLFLKLVIMGLKKADRIITVSKFSKKDIAKRLNYPEKKIDVITDAVDHNRYYPKRDKQILEKYNISKNEKVILYVGSERKRQNIPFLLKGLYELKKILPEVILVKIGNPQQPGARKNLLKLIKKLGLEKEVIFTGFVSEKVLSQWYNTADLFVYPCLYAGFGLPVLEAMACGTPVITSNLTSLPEVVGDAGITINPDNIDQLVESMYKVLTDKNLRENMAKKGIERAKMFSWEKSAEKTMAVYKKMAAR
jgi:glycosyltransferase involved in cell wall biosynthesis